MQWCNGIWNKKKERSSIRIHEYVSKNMRFKVTMVGEMSVGKSALALRMAKDKFLSIPDSTIGAAFSVISIKKGNIKNIFF